MEMTYLILSTIMGMEGYIAEQKERISDDIQNPKTELYSFIDRNRPTHTSQLATKLREQYNLNDVLTTTEHKYKPNGRISTSYIDWSGDGKSNDDLVIVEVSGEGTYATSLNPRGEVFQIYEDGTLVKFAADTMRASNFYTLASELDSVRKQQQERDLALQRSIALSCSENLTYTPPKYEPIKLDLD